MCFRANIFRANIFRAKILRAVPCHKSAGPRFRAVPGRPCIKVRIRDVFYSPMFVDAYPEHSGQAEDTESRDLLRKFHQQFHLPEQLKTASRMWATFVNERRNSVAKEYASSIANTILCEKTLLLRWLNSRIDGMVNDEAHFLSHPRLDGVQTEFDPETV